MASRRVTGPTPPSNPVGLLDLSHLTEEERQKILAVLQRDEEFRSEVDAKVKTTAEKLQRTASRSTRRSKTPAETRQTCGWCDRQVRAADVDLKQCAECKTLLCDKCQETLGKKSARHAAKVYCSECASKKKLKFVAGDWFSVSPAAKSNDNFGSSLLRRSIYHAKPRKQAQPASNDHEKQSNRPNQSPHDTKRHQQRMELQNRQTAAANTIKSHWKANRARCIQREEYVKLRHACRAIQQYWRGWKMMMVDEEDFQKVRCATTYLQQQWRAYAAGRKQCRKYQHILSSIIIIQQHWRGYQKGKAVRRELAEQEAACRTIQVRYKAYVIGSRQRADYLARKSAAYAIQVWWRASLLAQRCRVDYQRKRNACIVIQHHWRAWRCGRDSQAQYQSQRHACIVLQSQWRKVMAQRRTQKLRMEKVGISRTNFRSRAIRKGRNSPKVVHKKDGIATDVTSEVTTEVKAGVTTDDHLTPDVAVEESLASKEIIPSSEKPEREVTASGDSAGESPNLNKRGDGGLRPRQGRHRLSSSRRKRRDNDESSEGAVRASRLSQSRPRRYGNNDMTNEDRASALQLGASFEVDLPELCVSVPDEVSGSSLLDELNEAEVAFTSDNDRDTDTKRNSSAVTIQRHWKARQQGHAQRQQYLKLVAAITYIQQHWRGYQKGKAVRRELAEQEAACRTIQVRYQAYVIGSRQRADYLARKSAAYAIQVWWRASLLAQRCRVDYQRKRNACIVIQVRWRAKSLMRFCRDVYLERRAAAVSIQTWWRSLCLVRFCREVYLERKAAAVSIQDWWRSSRQARQCLAKYRQQRKASITIQQGYRAWISKREMNQVCENQRKAMTKREEEKLRQERETSAQLSRKLQRSRGAVRRSGRSPRAAKCVAEEKVASSGPNLDTPGSGQAAEDSVDGGTLSVLVAEELAVPAAISTTAADDEAALRNKRSDSQLRPREGRRMLSTSRRRRYESPDPEDDKPSPTLRRGSQLNKSRERHYDSNLDDIAPVPAVMISQGDSVVEERREQAATLLQTSWRRHHCQMIYRQKKHAACVLQLQWRAHCARKVEYKYYQALLGACRSMQLRHRENTKTRKQRASYRELRQACISCQRQVRAYQQARPVRSNYLKQLSAVILLQRFWRAACAGKAQRSLYLSQRLKTTQMQQRVRANQASRSQRKEFLRLKQSATIIQKSWRLCLLHRRRQAEIEIKHQAARVIQHQLRLFVRRKVRQQQEQQRQQEQVSSALIIQSCWRMCSERKKYQRQLKCVTFLQSLVRQQIASREFHVARESIVSAQRRRRATLAMRECQKQYQATLRSSRLLQRVVRGWLARSRLRKQQLAATIIQSSWRGMKPRKQYHSQQCAARVIQRQWKRYQLLKSLSSQELEMMTKAAVVIQAHWRGRVCRTTWRKITKAVLCIQSWYRSRRLSRRYQHIRRGVVNLQAHTRRHLATKEYHRKKQAVCVLQDRWRSYQIALTTRKQYQAFRISCVVFQAMSRGWLVRKRIKDQRSSVTSIQAAWRGSVQRRQYSATRHNVIKVQAIARGFIARRSLSNRYCAVVRVQAAWRGYSARQRYQARLNTIVKFQACCRGYLQRLSLAAQRSHRHQAAVMIQASWKCHVAQKKFAFQREVIVQLQALCRGYLYRRLYNAQLSHQHRAAIAIQSSWKGHMAQQKYASRREVIVQLQAVCRGHLYRRLYNAQLSRQHRAAIAIQSSWKGHMAQQKYASKREVIVQLQALCRGYLYRWLYNAQLSCQHRAAIAIQSSWKGHMAQQKYASRREVIVQLQAVCRGYLYRRLYNAQLSRQHRAAIAIQSSWKGHMAQQKYASNRAVIVQLQAVCRGYLFRELYSRQLSRQKQAAEVIQANWKGSLQARRYHTMRNASVVLQSAHRGHVARKSVQLLREQDAERKIKETAALTAVHKGEETSAPAVATVDDVVTDEKPDVDNESSLSAGSTRLRGRSKVTRRRRGDRGGGDEVPSIDMTAKDADIDDDLAVPSTGTLDRLTVERARMPRRRLPSREFRQAQAQAKEESGEDNVEEEGEELSVGDDEKVDKETGHIKGRIAEEGTMLPKSPKRPPGAFALPGMGAAFAPKLSPKPKTPGVVPMPGLAGSKQESTTGEEVEATKDKLSKVPPPKKPKPKNVLAQASSQDDIHMRAEEAGVEKSNEPSSMSTDKPPYTRPMETSVVPTEEDITHGVVTDAQTNVSVVLSLPDKEENDKSPEISSKQTEEPEALDESSDPNTLSETRPSFGRARGRKLAGRRKSPNVQRSMKTSSATGIGEDGEEETAKHGTGAENTVNTDTLQGSNATDSQAVAGEDGGEFVTSQTFSRMKRQAGVKRGRHRKSTDAGTASGGDSPGTSRPAAFSTSSATYAEDGSPQLRAANRSRSSLSAQEDTLAAAGSTTPQDLRRARAAAVAKKRAQEMQSNPEQKGFDSYDAVMARSREDVSGRSRTSSSSSTASGASGRSNSMQRLNSVGRLSSFLQKKQVEGGDLGTIHMGLQVSAAGSKKVLLNVRVTLVNDIFAESELDTYVKCHLLPDTKTKVKTSVCKSSLLPSWDEVLSFPKMKQPDLVNSVLEVALCKHGLLGRSDTLGAVRVGFTASTVHDSQVWRDCTEVEAATWKSLVTETATDQWLDVTLPLRQVSAR